MTTVTVPGYRFPVTVTVTVSVTVTVQKYVWPGGEPPGHTCASKEGFVVRPSMCCIRELIAPHSKYEPVSPVVSLAGQARGQQSRSAYEGRSAHRVPRSQCKNAPGSAEPDIAAFIDLR